MPDARQTFKETVATHKATMNGFLAALEKEPPEQLDTYADPLDRDVWAETDCLTCSNCCRNMTPVFTVADIKRIATHFRMSVPAFKAKWLYQNKNGAWMNRLQPCPFLDLQTNKCSIYAIRPEDCAGFPHLTKKSVVEYLHVHKQNIEFCPATFKFVEKLMQLVSADVDKFAV